MKQQQIPQGYKLTEVGVIPEDWRITRIGDFSPLQRGFDLPSTLTKEGIYPVIYSNGIGGYHNKYQARGAGVVTGRSGTLGKVHYCESDYWPHNTTLWVTKFNNADVKFVYYIFTYINFERFASGSGVPTLNRNDAHDFKVAVPLQKTEQITIANALSDTDALINQLKKLIAKKQAVKTATMQQLLTGKTRLPAFAYTEDGRLKGTKQSELGETPEDWSIQQFGHLVNYLKGYPFKSSEYASDGLRIIRVSDTTFYSIKDTDPVYISMDKVFQYRKWALKQDDLIFSTVGSKPPMYDSLVGKVILIPKKYAGSLLNQNAVLIRAKNSKVKNIQRLFLNHFRTKRYIDFIEMIYRGNANQASITLEHLFQYQLPLPTDDDEQTAIATILSDIDSEIQTLEQRLAKTEQIKQGMMQELLTGKTRLVS